MEFKKLDLPLSVLINNSSITPPSQYTCNSDGIELQFMENYLGHFLLTNLLVPSLLKSTPSRVVCLTSKAHEDMLPNWYFNLQDLPPQKELYNPLRNHGLSKLCVILFMKAFSQKYSKYNLIGISCNPGIITPNNIQHTINLMMVMYTF